MIEKGNGIQGNSIKLQRKELIKVSFGCLKMGPVSNGLYVRDCVSVLRIETISRNIRERQGYLRAL